MEINRILAEIDAQIAKLQQARALLAGTNATSVAAVTKKAVGRPRKNTLAPAPAKASKKRVLSPEARKRIADAQKKRWAESRKKA